MGGLGANIGSDDWEKAKKKSEQAQEYAKQLRLQNQNKPPPSKPKKEAEPKEKTTREKALEFAKNIPKPKVKKSTQESEEDNEPKRNSDLLNGIIEEEPYD